MTSPKRGRGTVKVDAATNNLIVTPRGELLRRTPKSKGRIAALDELQLKLAVAAELYTSLDDDGKSGVKLAVVAAIRYFESQGIPQSALAPLIAVGAAIADTANGVTNPIFEPRRKRGAPKKTMQETSINEYLAVITECCVRHLKAQGRKAFLADASRMAADMVNKSAWNITVNATRMREVRESVTGFERGTFGRMEFDILLEGEPAESQPLWTAKHLLSTGSVFWPKLSV